MLFYFIFLTALIRKEENLNYSKLQQQIVCFTTTLDTLQDRHVFKCNYFLSFVETSDMHTSIMRGLRSRPAKADPSKSLV